MYAADKGWSPVAQQIHCHCPHHGIKSGLFCSLELIEDR